MVTFEGDINLLPYSVLFNQALYTIPDYWPSFRAAQDFEGGSVLWLSYFRDRQASSCGFFLLVPPLSLSPWSAEEDSFISSVLGGLIGASACASTKGSKG
ncbi:hypothetical protein Nepgr_002006 [Nepenthes gracilis]|uniref:Uncharacterized protein n=1 Tax=Nepenthes gracilis TaxID=150966 RepID=A0AAD3RWH0_NEPGR|nr:hypothetical protein Nepgr_002006 [Nepenthes gracilis]